MFRNLLLTIGIVLTANLLVFSQGSGALKGRITDKETREPIAFANIIVQVGGVQQGGSMSDFDGNYLIKPVPPGKVDVTATYVGYKGITIKGVVIAVDKITFLDLEMEATSLNLTETEIIDYKVPLISKDQTSSGGTVTSEEIDKMPNKSAASVATTIGGVQTDANGNITSLRGQRESGTVYYIDGVRVIGSLALPQSAIEQVDVVLGGTPAAYGDATGGIISVTTRGPSKELHAGFELQTSQFLDKFGYNRVGLNLNGPLFSKKDTSGNKTPIVGYFIAGDFIYQKDGAPNATGIWKVKDDVLEDLEKYPLRLSGTGEGGVYYNAEYLTKNDLEKVSNTQNTRNIDVNMSGKLDFRLSKTINMAIGGTFVYSDNYDFIYGYSLMNYKNNPHSTDMTWRINGRLTQRFPTSPDSKSLIKNIYYTLSADYTKRNFKREDANHQDDLFKYGYVGKFSSHTIRAYTPEKQLDTVTGKFAFIQNGFRDTLLAFEWKDINPELANWTAQYYSFFDSPIGHYQNWDEVVGGRGLVNGVRQDAVYGAWSNAGAQWNGYNVTDVSQIGINAFVALDIGNNEIQAGFQYQQRSSSGYGYSPISLWNIMRGQTNFHLRELDVTHPRLVYRDGVFMDTIYYFRKYADVLQRNFDINLRKKLGLRIDGTDWIDINSYDFDNNSIQYFDENQVAHTIYLNDNLFTIDMFSADELLNGGDNLVNYYGYDYTGKKLKNKPSFNDFFLKKDANGNYTRDIGAYEPIYIAGFIQDKFAFRDLIFNIGVRVDRFDANQMVLKDPYLFNEAFTADKVTEVGGLQVNHPGNIGNDYVVYVDNVDNPATITGYRFEDKWYNAEGSVISDPRVLDKGSGVSPYLRNPSDKSIKPDVFKDYEPQTNIMPRIAFSFPISDEALFYAHYDILTQRPTGLVQVDPISYYFIKNAGAAAINNPNLKPEKTIDYELGFQQKVSNTSSLKLSVFYREMRDQIQAFRFTGAYPFTYYSYNNIDFGTVKGLTITYDLRRSGNARVRASYTLQFADGTGSDANTAFNLIRSDQPNLRTLNPLSFDRRHQFNIDIDYRFGEGKEYNGPRSNRVKSGKRPIDWLQNTGIHITLTGGSGTPYTKSSEIMPFGGMGPISGSVNGSRLPWQFHVNARLDRDISLGKKKQTFLNIYLEALNVFNTKNVTGVYPATGVADDDGYLAAAEFQQQINQQQNPQSYRDLYSIFIANPYNYSTPRQVRLGLSLNF